MDEMKKETMITDRDWSIGETYQTRDGKTWRVTRLEHHAIGVIPWVIQVTDDEDVVVDSGAYGGGKPYPYGEALKEAEAARARGHKRDGEEFERGLK